MSTKKDKAKKEKPASTASKHPLKKRKSPRGQKVAKVVDQLLATIDHPKPRVAGVTRRDQYNERLSRVAKLARLL